MKLETVVDSVIGLMDKAHENYNLTHNRKVYDKVREAITVEIASYVQDSIYDSNIRNEVEAYMQEQLDAEDART